MSRTGVKRVIETLLTDESMVHLSDSRLIERRRWPNSVCEGSSSPAKSMDLFTRTDARVWFLGDRVGNEWRQ